MVTDGSYNPGTQFLESETCDSWMVVILEMLSDKPTHETYWAECNGIFGILIVLDILCNQCNVTQGSITLGCDGLSAWQSVMLEIKDRHVHNSDHSDHSDSISP